MGRWRFAWWWGLAIVLGLGPAVHVGAQVTVPLSCCPGGGGGGTGDVSGPASATDECFPRFDTTTGKNIQNSVVCATDAGRLQLGGQTSSFCAIAPRTGSTQQLDIMLADGSGFTDAWTGRLYAASGTPASRTAKVAMENSIGLSLAGDTRITFSSGAGAGGDGDTGISRAAAGVTVFDASARGDRAGWYQWSGQCRVAADQTNATTAFADINCVDTAGTNGIKNLQAGRKYPFRCWFSLNQSTAADGAKFDFAGGTATETSFRASVAVYDTALALVSHPDDLIDVSSVSTLTGLAHAEVSGDFIPSAAGTFIPRFAENSSTTGDLTLHAGSWCTMDDSP